MIGAEDVAWDAAATPGFTIQLLPETELGMAMLIAEDDENTFSPLQPVYIARQLICIQNGSSAGVAAALMKKVVANLSEDDIIAISAYVGSLPPR